MTCVRNVTANFELGNYHVTTNTKPENGGQVIVEPSQSADGYTAGTKVTVQAKPNNGYIFKGWGGDVSGKQNTIVMSMDTDKAITATFAKKLPYLLIWSVGGAVVILLFGFMFYFLAHKKR